MSAPISEPISEPGNASVSVPATGHAVAEARRTDPKSFLVRGVAVLAQLAIPIAVAGYSILSDGKLGDLIAYIVPLVIVVIAFNFGAAYLQWLRLTYTVGVADIRVESGVLSRSARSVPYERIQDVSLEQKLLARLFGLVAVKFETGAGGGDDLTLTYLSDAEGERLRQLIRARRDAQTDGQADAAIEVTSDKDAASVFAQDQADVLFAMGPRRLFTFGLFEFSLAVFAVLAGVLQYADGFYDFKLDDFQLWQAWIEQQGSLVTTLGPYVQVVGVILGLIGVFIVGSVTGLLRTFTRDWGFLLERTPRGFRRRRGLFTRTDVVMPVHRVQGVKIGTGLLRYRFGWHSLRFVSLAQDAGAANHDVAPFATMDEIGSVVASAGFHLPDENADWHRASEAYRTDSMIIDSLFFVIAAAVAGTILAIYAPDWALPAVLILIGLAVFSAGAALYSWQFKRHSLDDTQIMARAGIMSPSSQIATRTKLHSVEVAQGPIARHRGYATLHLGLAGGEFSIPGVPVERAREVRRKVLDTIAATDFSELETA